jgi:hypothetical protein
MSAEREKSAVFTPGMEHVTASFPLDIVSKVLSRPPFPCIPSPL